MCYSDDNNEHYCALRARKRRILDFSYCSQPISTAAAFAVAFHAAAVVLLADAYLHFLLQHVVDATLVSCDGVNCFVAVDEFDDFSDSSHCANQDDRFYVDNLSFDNLILIRASELYLVWTYCNPC